MERTGCLIRCHGEHCSSSQCCSKEKFMEDSCLDVSIKQRHSINKKLEGKEIIPAPSVVDLKRFILHDNEGPRSYQPRSDNITDRSACCSDDGEVQVNKDKTLDSGSYAINVDVNDQKCTTSRRDSDQEITSEH